jgi:sugar O-acyltransferase (sialic acid O-acetyltransferase NeuD family)
VATELVIWGASGHAKVVADVAENADFRVVGFVDDLRPELDGTPFFGACIVGSREGLLALRDQGLRHLVIGFGHCRGRMAVAQWAVEQGFVLPTLVHPSAVIASSARLGRGTVAAAGVVVNPDAVVGANAILNTSCSVDHDCQIADGAHICPGAHLAGDVTVGEASWIGIGSSVREGVNIGHDVMIGAGSAVLADIPDEVVAYGSPARVRGAWPTR